MFEYQLAYLFLNLILLPIWLLLFYKRNDLRHKIILLSFLVGFVGMLSKYWYHTDYWNPLSLFNTYFLIEDFLFGFLIGGIGSVVYEELFGLKFSNRKTRKHHWALFFIFFLGISITISNLLFLNLGINSIYASLIGFMVVGLGFIIFRMDLIKDALISGAACGCILLLSYIILLYFYPLVFSAFWQLHNLSGVSIGKIPIEELFWAFGFGFVIGPMYEFYAGIKLKN